MLGIRQPLSIACQPVIGLVKNAAHDRQPRRCNQPAEADRGVGASEDLYAGYDASVRQDGVDSLVDRFVRQAVSARIEVRVADVLECKTAVPAIKPAQKRRFAPAQRALTVD